MIQSCNRLAVFVLQQFFKLLQNFHKPQKNPVQNTGFKFLVSKVLAVFREIDGED